MWSIFLTSVRWCISFVLILSCILMKKSKYCLKIFQYSQWFHGFCEDIHSKVKTEVKHVLSVTTIIDFSKEKKQFQRKNQYSLNFCSLYLMVHRMCKLKFIINFYYSNYWKRWNPWLQFFSRLLWYNKLIM